MHCHLLSLQSGRVLCNLFQVGWPCRLIPKAFPHHSHQWQRPPWTVYHVHCTMVDAQLCRWYVCLCEAGVALTCTGWWCAFGVSAQYPLVGEVCPRTLHCCCEEECAQPQSTESTSLVMPKWGRHSLGSTGEGVPKKPEFSCSIGLTGHMWTVMGRASLLKKKEDSTKDCAPLPNIAHSLGSPATDAIQDGCLRR